MRPVSGGLLLVAAFALLLLPVVAWPQSPPPSELVVTRHGTNAVRLTWESKAGVKEYAVLRSETLGWSGNLKLLADIKKGDQVVKVETTDGLSAGDELYINSRNECEIQQVVDRNTLRLVHPAKEGLATSRTLELSGCWVRDYSGYTTLTKSPRAGEYVDANLTPEKDYFYVIGYSDGARVTSCSNPVNVKLTATGILYDAALGCNGGNAWRVTQQYGDTPNLIDGNPKTSVLYIQCHNPKLPLPRRHDVFGFHRVQLNDRLRIKRVEIAQDPARTQVSRIRLGFDDRSVLDFDLQKDKAVERSTESGQNVFKIPVDKTSAHVSLYIEDVVNTENFYITWSKIGVYTDEPVRAPVTSAGQLRSTTLALDFSQPDGKLPTVFGTDEIYDNVEGQEFGWMLNSWPYTTKVFNLYRIQMGDFWPRAYGVDLLKVAELAKDVSAQDTALALKPAHAYLGKLANNAKLRIGAELLRFTSGDDKAMAVTRGAELTPPKNYRAGTAVHAYKDVGQLLRLQEILPEFKVERIPDAYVSGLTPVNPELPITHASRTAKVENVKMVAGDFGKGDVIRIGREMFQVLTVSGRPGDRTLTLQRGFDGTNQPYIQHNNPVRDVYRIRDYEPCYAGFKNDPADPKNYFWDNFRTSMDKCIRAGDAVPWIIVYSTEYATNSRGRVAAIETVANPRGIRNNVIVDEYNSQHDDGDWWYRVAEGNDEKNDSVIRGNMYQYYHAELHMLTGQAAGKVFYVRSHSADRLRVTKTKNDTWWTNTDPEYVDLAAEGVKPGDAYKVTQGSNRMTPNVTRRFWQYNADMFYQVARFIRETYAAELAGRPIYMEYYLEPNLGNYGTWVLDAYVDSYNVFAKTLRLGGPHFKQGFPREQVALGGGAIAGGLNPGIPMPGAEADYALARALVERGNPIDFVSHHRYYMGSRVQKRETSWEYWMLRAYAKSLGKDIFIVDSEDSVATAGGTGREEARHYAQFSVPYWTANFINSYCGEYGELGRNAFIIHFRLYYRNDQSLGMAAADAQGNPILDLMYWPILMYQNHSSKKTTDTLAKVIKGSDQYGWVQAVGAIHGETAVKKVHLVNKKAQPVTVNLVLHGAQLGPNAYMDSVIGSGPKQTLKDGYHPPDLKGAIVRTKVTDLSQIVLEPHSAHVLSLE